MTRIVAGSRGGRILATPPGTGTRPTSDRVREALFSALGAMTELAGGHVLDLYAGSGAVGLEAASRGARQVLLVEADPRVVRVIRANIATLDLAGTCQVAPMKVAGLLSSAPADPFDIVFADPPYALTDAELTGVLGSLSAQRWLAPGAVLAIERLARSAEPSWPEGVTLERSRRYGSTALWYGRRA